MADKIEKTVKEEDKGDTFSVISKVITFLRTFMPETMAKRIICCILLSVGILPKEVARISGFCPKTVANIKKKIDDNEIDAIFVIRGGGRKSILAEFEGAIVDEVLQGQYHSKQQIADMIKEKYGITVTPQCVGKLLKKTKLGV